MRHIFPALLLVLAGCGGGPDLYEKEMEVRGYDFTEYTEEGFLITPKSYQGEYQSIGTLSITVWPRIERRNTTEGDDPSPGPDEAGNTWIRTDPVRPQEVVDSLYARAQSLGADAVMDFNTEAVTENLNEGPTRVGIRAYGFAIDRVEN